MEDRDLIDLDARVDKPPRVEVVVVPDSPAGLWGDPDPAPAPVHIAAPVALPPTKSVALPATAPAPWPVAVEAPPERFARRSMSTTASWVASFAGVGLFAGGLYLTLSWAAEAFSAVGRWFTGAGPWLVLGGLLVIGTLAARYVPVRTRSGVAARWTTRVPGGFARLGGYPRSGGRGSLAVVGGATVAGVRRVLHGNRGAAAEQASAGVWSDGSGSAGYGEHSPGGVASGVRRFGADGVEITHSTGAYGAVPQYGGSGLTYPGQSTQGHDAPGQVDPATGLYVGHGSGFGHPHAAGAQWVNEGTAGYSAGAYPNVGFSAPNKSAREMTRPAALATWLFGPAEGPVGYGASASGVLSRNRWATQSPGMGASRLDPSIDRTFSAWLFDESAPWSRGDGRPVQGLRLSIEDLTLTHRWCDRMRSASSSELVHGEWSHRTMFGCRFCAVGFLFDESDPNGWDNSGDIWKHRDAEKLFARYGRDFLMDVSNIFEGGTPLPAVADFVEANCA